MTTTESPKRLLLFSFLIVLLLGWYILPETAVTPNFSVKNAKTDASISYPKAVIIQENSLMAIASLFASPRFQILASVSAYTSRPEETDDSPFINAMGLRVQKGDIANNCLPFNTRVKIDGVTYIVRDRKNSRFSCEFFDIWMDDLEKAREFGRQKLIVEIY